MLCPERGLSTTNHQIPDYDLLEKNSKDIYKKLFSKDALLMKIISAT